MKKSEIFISLIVFCTFFVIGCLKVGGDRGNETDAPLGVGPSVSFIKQEKKIRNQVSQLHKKYNLRFYVLKTTPFSYKLKVGGDVDLDTLVEDLERFELDSEKYLGLLSNKALKKSFNRKLFEKLKAIKSFLDNHTTDNSFFSGKHCPDISGVYSKTGLSGEEEFITIKSKGCEKFEVSRNTKRAGPSIKLGEIEGCKEGRGYKICFRGRKMASNHVEFVFLEKWELENCTKENWVQVDEKGGSLVSKVLQICKGARVNTSQNSHTFFKVGAMN